MAKNTDAENTWKSLLQRAREALLGKKKHEPESEAVEIELPTLAPPDSDKDESEQDKKANIERALALARSALANHLPRFTTISFDLGVTSAIACAVGAIASPAGGLDDKALVTLMGSLGVNWLATAVWEWRNKAKQMTDPKAEAQALAKAIAPNLSDAALVGALDKLGLMETALQSIQNQNERLKLANDAVARGFATPQQVGTYVGGNVDTHGGAFIGRDQIINNYYVKGSDGWQDLKSDLELYLRDIAREVGDIDLTTIDPQSADGEAAPIRLDAIYTPLRADGGANQGYAELQRDEIIVRIGSRNRQGTDEEVSRSNLIALLNDAPRSVILGDPGSGKSTVLNYLTLGLCGQIKEEDQWFKDWQHRQLLPMRVELRNFARWLLTSDGRRSANEPCWQLFTYIQERIQKAAPRLAGNLREALLQQGGAFLLDGLDEVPSAQRIPIKQAIEQLAGLFVRCRFIVTCRSYSYRDAGRQIRPREVPFTTLTVRDLEDDQIEYFVRKWYEQAGTKRGTLDWESRASRLFAAITDPANPRLYRLSANPLLLSLIASLHSFRGGDLPRNRQELLKESVDLLLIRWQRRKKLETSDEQKSPETEDERKVFEALERQGTDSILNALYELAWDIHFGAARDAIDNPEATADIPFSKLRAALNKVTRGSGADISRDAWIAYLSNRAGLIIERGDDPAHPSDEVDPAYRFPHRMFQEYLAAMAKKDEPDTVAELLDRDFARWREVYALIGLINTPLATKSCVDAICLGTPSTVADWRRAVLAASIWSDKLQRAEEPRKTFAPSVEMTRQRLIDLLNAPAMLSPAERAEAGRILAELYNPDPVRFACADHRHGACANLSTSEGLLEYARNGFVPIKAKDMTFTMQAGNSSAGKATMKDNYLMAKTLVTYAQFEAFVADPQGCRNDAHWTRAGLAWRADRTEPRYWKDPKWHIANHPVIGVTWYESAAFCHWLTSRLQTLSQPFSQFNILNAQFEVRLPSELEWEYAARRDNGRDYPWNRDARDEWTKGDEAHCNVRETGLGRTTAVGAFPNGATLDGFYDLTGNTWEWMGTTWNADWRKVSEDLEGDSERGLRGGSWASNHENDLGYRNWNDPRLDYDNLGFRVVVRAHFSF